MAKTWFLCIYRCTLKGICIQNYVALNMVIEDTLMVYIYCPNAFIVIFKISLTSFYYIVDTNPLLHS
jgi:hypothetical protein